MTAHVTSPASRHLSPRQIPVTASIDLKHLPDRSRWCHFFNTINEKTRIFDTPVAITCYRLYVTKFFHGEKDREAIDFLLREGFEMHSSGTLMVLHHLTTRSDPRPLNEYDLVHTLDYVHSSLSLVALDYQRRTSVLPPRMSNFLNGISLWIVPGQMRQINFHIGLVNGSGIAVGAADEALSATLTGTFDDLWLPWISHEIQQGKHDAAKATTLVNTLIGPWTDAMDQLFPEESGVFGEWVKEYGEYLKAMAQSPETVAATATPLHIPEPEAPLPEHPVDPVKEKLSRRETAEVFGIPLMPASGTVVKVTPKATPCDAWQLPSPEHHSTLTIPSWVAQQFFCNPTLNQRSWKDLTGWWFVKRTFGASETVAVMDQETFESQYDLHLDEVKV